jgi:hemoglobin/transferrin/lactoferrin receptor protein
MKGLFLVFGVFFGSIGLMAQVDTQADSLQEIVISANKTSEQKRDLANQVEILTARSIAAVSPSTLADVLQNSGHVFVQRSQQGGGSPVLRGFEANKVLLVVDGVRMNNAIYRSGHLQTIITLDPAVVERLEVLYGSGSVTYGSDAIGGVVSVFTKRPELAEAKRYISVGGFARYASANRGATAHVTLRSGGQKWAHILSLTTNQFGDLRSGARGMRDYPGFGDRHWYVQRIAVRDTVLTNPDPRVQVGSGYRQLDMFQKLLFRQNARLSHLLNVQFSTSSNVPRYDRLTDTRNGAPRFGAWYYGPQERLLAACQTEWAIQRPFADMMRFTPAFQRVGESRFDRTFGNPQLNARTERILIGSANLDFFKETRGHEIRYGAEVVHNDLVSRGERLHVDTDARSPLQSRYPSGVYQSVGAFVSHRWEVLGKKLIVSDGLRYSAVAMRVHFDPDFALLPDQLTVSQRNQAVNFHLGLTSNLRSGTRLTAAINTGFRNPNIDDAGKVFETTSATLHIPNAALRPEYVLSQEVHLGQKINDLFEMGITGFVSNLSNAIATRPTTYLGQQVIVYQGDTLMPVHSTNVAKARVQGLSASARLKLPMGLNFDAKLQYTHGRDITDRLAVVPLDHIPPLMSSVRAGYGRARWQSSVDVLHQGWKRLKDYSDSGEDNQQYATPDGTPAWTIWNVRAHYRINKRFKLQCAVENIFDQRYRAFASGINGSGRNVVVELITN